MIDVQEHDAVNAGSERNFGLVFAGVFAIIGLWPLVHAAGPAWWALAVAVGFLCVALLVPSILRPLNILWFRLGMLLGRIVSPIVMGLIFFAAVTPTALLFKLRKEDLLYLGRDSNAGSYWIRRDESAGGSMRDQF
jgi:hypothetical protein